MTCKLATLRAATRGALADPLFSLLWVPGRRLSLSLDLKILGTTEIQDCEGDFFEPVRRE